MATTLPPIVHGPFDRYFHRKPYILQDFSTPLRSISNGSASSVPSSCLQKPRRSSPSSAISTSSAPVNILNDENHGGKPRHVFTGYLEERTFSLQDSRKYQFLDQDRPTISTQPPAKERTGQPRHHLSTDHVRCDSRLPTPKALRYWDGSAGALEEPASPHSSRESFFTPPSPSRSVPFEPLVNVESQADRVASVASRVQDPIQFADWAEDFRSKRNRPPHTPIRSLLHALSPEDRESNQSRFAHTLPRAHFGHQRRASKSSSGYVETLQTASFSNASFSIAPRSYRKGRSSDTRANRSSGVRYSIDSDCVIGRPSLDEQAAARARRRGQILHEILSSEESYLADLRALSSLFSTLLPSVPSLPARARSSTQRTLHDIVQLHADIVHDLHQITCFPVSQRQRHNSTLHRLVAKTHLKRHSLDIGSPSRARHSSHHQRSSTDSVLHRPEFFHAEPSKAAEYALLFRRYMPRFLVYEEYCSNHETMLRELSVTQRSLPYWQLYETGIEALTRSLRAIDQRRVNSRRALTVGDLLIAPVQKVTKYPLLFADLHKSTPVIDCPDAQSDVDLTLQQFRELVKEINQAKDDPTIREKVRKRWLLQDRLEFVDAVLSPSQFRSLGHSILCGVLHTAYQSRSGIAGGYAMCVLFATHLAIAVPVRHGRKFEVITIVYLPDLSIVSTEDGRGLQCHTALFSWKLIFESQRHLYEVILSACSATEEEQWNCATKDCKKSCRAEALGNPVPSAERLTTTIKRMRPVGELLGPPETVPRRTSIQRAATVGNRPNLCQVIIKNTHNPQDSQDSRNSGTSGVHRSQSLLSTHRIVVMAPKRSERVRLESALADVWTRDTLPFPGMALPRGGQMIRASAGSLARKLSLASIHGPFGRRSASLSMSMHRKSTETLRMTMTQAEPSARRGASGPGPQVDEQEKRSNNNTKVHEAITIYRDGGQMEAGPSRGSLLRRSTLRKQRPSSVAITESAAPAETDSAMKDVIEEKLGGKKRWSNPLGWLKNTSAEGVRNILYSSK